MKVVKKSGAGRLYDANGFLVPVVTGSWFEMGQQYGALMVDHMEKTWDLLKGDLDKATMAEWAQRARSSCSTRNRQWYGGVTKGTGWESDKVIMLDMIMEYGFYQSKCHSFAGCTSILSWGAHSADGGMHVGRNFDWDEVFNLFPQVVCVRKPNDGSFKYATAGFAGMYNAFTALNEHGTYFDMHDGTSMGGSIIFKQRPSLLNQTTDFMCECASLEALKMRLQGTNNSMSIILSLADEKGAASMECSSLGGNRVREPEGRDQTMAVANTFFDKDWGLGCRETVSNSIRRHDNMLARLKENKGKVDAKKVRELMDLRLFNDDGSFSTGCTKPKKQDADLTNYTMVTDVKARKIWMKIPVPEHFKDWTEIDVGKLWA